MEAAPKYLNPTGIAKFLVEKSRQMYGGKNGRVVPVYTDEIEAIGRLVEQHGELLAACQEALAVLDDQTKYFGIEETLAAAIIKATGGTG